MIVFPDPWDALCLARALPGRAVATFGGEHHRREFEALGVEAVVLPPPPGELLTRDLLAHPSVDPGRERVLCFKPAAQLEELGYRLAHAAARLAQGLENKLKLSELAAEAGLHLPDQGPARVGDTTWSELARRFGGHFVAQSPRGFAGRRTFEIRQEDDWTALSGSLAGRPVKVTAWVEGAAGTSGTVVDREGRVLVTAPIFQITGDPQLTPHPLGSCGNDFTWRPLPHPGAAPAELAEQLGPVLASRGYRGHFGIDWVWDGDRCWLIEINPRLTASFPLYARLEPRLVRAHLQALEEHSIEGGRLEPVRGGQLIFHNLDSKPTVPLASPDAWPHPGEHVPPGSKRGHLFVPGEVVSSSGRLVPSLVPFEQVFTES